MRVVADEENLAAVVLLRRGDVHPSGPTVTVSVFMNQLIDVELVEADRNESEQITIRRKIGPQRLADALLHGFVDPTPRLRSAARELPRQMTVGGFTFDVLRSRAAAYDRVDGRT